MEINRKTLKEQYEQFLYTLHTVPEAITFTHKHQLWRGFWRYGWVARLLVVVGILAGLKFLSVFFKWFGQVKADDPLVALSSMGGLVADVFKEEYQFFFAGGLKYVLMIILEILVFHICRRSLELLNVEGGDVSLKSFIKAQIRMIKVVGASWLMETVSIFALKLAFNFFPFSVIEPVVQPVLTFGVQCFFMGFVVMDNYSEQFHLSIKESLQYAKNYIGIAVAIGFMLQLLFLIPVFGSIIGPFVAAVVATLVMYQLTDLHLLKRELAVKLDELV